MAILRPNLIPEDPMKSFIIATLLLLTTTVAQAEVEKCYSLYMRENSDDPASACVIFDSETAEALVLNLYIIGGELKESFPLVSDEQIVGYKGHLALHYNNIKGEGQFHKVSASQNYGSLQLMSLRVYSTVDGNLQTAVEFNRKPVRPGNGCTGKGRCI